MTIPMHLGVVFFRWSYYEIETIGLDYAKIGTELKYLIFKGEIL
jgi:hypothetical protein